MQQDVQGKVDSRAMREVNRSIVLDIIRRGGRVSRTDLARRSALTKPTVSAIVEDLLARGIVQEVGYGKTVASGGRRARLLEFNDASAAYLGIRFGVHKTTVGVADARGELRARREFLTPHGDARAGASAALAIVDAVCADAGFPRDRIQAAGVTVPGLVDYATGTVALAPNLEWKNVPVRELFAGALGVPVVVNNVTNAGAIAEGRVGVTKGVRSFVWLHVGSGVGAGIVVGGQVFPGTQGFSGEIGHCSVAEGGPKCGCGKRGCLETLASGPAIARIAQEGITRGERTTLSSMTEIDAAVVAREARAGDSFSRRIFEEVGAHLGVGISYLANILDPEMIVLGGNVMQAGDLLLESARRTTSERSLKGSRMPVVLSTLGGDDAGLIGSVFAAMDQAVRSYRVVATGERAADFAGRERVGLG